MGMTDFDPRVDGFAFSNTWTGLGPADLQQIGEELRNIAFVASFAPEFLPLVLTLGGPPVGNIALAEIVQGLVGQVTTAEFGLCGGMACAGLDYFRLRWVPPRGRGA